METDDNGATEENTDHAQMSVASRGFHPEGLYLDFNCPSYPVQTCVQIVSSVVLQ